MTNEPQSQLLQKINLDDEIKLSLSLIESGLALLQQQRSFEPTAKRFTRMFLLSTGLEHFLKVVLCLSRFEKRGSFPSKESMMNWGHNLDKLRDEVLEKCFTVSYLKKPHAKADYEFVARDPVFRLLLALLTDFANPSDRYFYMNNIASPTNKVNPDIRWEDLERCALSDERYSYLISEGRIDEIRQEAIPKLVASLERFLRALARLMTLAELGKQAAVHTGDVQKFLYLKDDGLGRKNIYGLWEH